MRNRRKLRSVEDVEDRPVPHVCARDMSRYGTPSTSSTVTAPRGLIMRVRGGPHIADGIPAHVHPVEAEARCWVNKVSAVVRKQNKGVVRMVTGGHHRDLFELVENRNTEAYITAHAQVAGADRAQAKKIRAELRIVQLLK